MHMITKESPLNGMNIGTVASVAIREVPGLTSIDLRVAPGSSSQTAVAEALGIDLPAMPGQMRATTTSNGSQAYELCLAPDWWLIVGLDDAEQKLAPLRLKDEYHFSTVDVSGQRTTIEMEGPKSRDVLAHFWEQDLREKTFPVGRVSQGLIAKAPVIVYRIAPWCYRLMVRSSFALHVWNVLADAVTDC